jgi:anion-transporting  ArsA/GET3 family ATPase
VRIILYTGKGGVGKTSSRTAFNVAKFYGVVKEWMHTLFTWRGLDDLMAEELAIVPGMDELASLFWIAEHHDSGAFDTIIADCAPLPHRVASSRMPERARLASTPSPVDLTGSAEQMV